MRVIAVIEDEQVIKKILKYLVGYEKKAPTRCQLAAYRYFPRI